MNSFSFNRQMRTFVCSQNLGTVRNSGSGYAIAPRMVPGPSKLSSLATYVRSWVIGKDRFDKLDTGHFRKTKPISCLL